MKGENNSCKILMHVLMWQTRTDRAAGPLEQTRGRPIANEYITGSTQT
jgi:hypothetical protein